MLYSDSSSGNSFWSLYAVKTLVTDVHIANRLKPSAVKLQNLLVGSVKLT